MTATYFIGDPHFGHEKVSQIRGFDTVMEHDVAIMDAWNKVVKDRDIVYILGDLSNGKSEDEARALDIIESLPGHKRLIAGNHDSISGIHRRPSKNRDRFYEVFERASDFGRVKSEGEHVHLSHFPYISQGDGPGRGHARYEQWRLPDLGGLLIHAHTHHTHAVSGSVTGRELCVSWDAWKRMVTEADVSKWVKMGQMPTSDVYKELAIVVGYFSVYGQVNTFDPPILFPQDLTDATNAAIDRDTKS